jgi:uncharacterized metal-binding protein YceD (DUF177 family)
VLLSTSFRSLHSEHLFYNAHCFSDLAAGVAVNRPRMRCLAEASVPIDIKYEIRFFRSKSATTAATRHSLEASFGRVCCCGGNALNLAVSGRTW